ncbi:MAG: RNA methyltransferase [Deltaproteobacteria bacterium]|nr:RNA methyltransferase [Deltaproteobacteria bacterium]
MVPAARAYVALLHHPVYDKRRRVVATAITNLDIHDLARACRTFGLGGFFLTTPIAAQRDLGRRIIGHWRGGFGAVYNERRKEALDIVTIASDLDEVRARVRELAGAEPLTCATCARPRGTLTEAQLLGEVRASGRPLLLLFGTGWGLTDEVLGGVDRVLRPIRGGTDYNHLSVRTAVAIVLDRLFGERGGPQAAAAAPALTGAEKST